MVKIPLFPRYDWAQTLIKFLNGKSVALFKSMWSSIENLTGTPQNPEDWQSPNEWIPQRLRGAEQKLALEIWTQSKGLVNPRHIKGIEFLMNGYDLIKDRNGVFELTPKGKVFVSAPENAVTAEIDHSEGCIFLLHLVSMHGHGRRKTFLSEWKDYLEKHSNYRRESIIKDSMRRRMVNLMERGMLIRQGNNYSITPIGESYLKKFKEYKPGTSLSEEAQLLKEVEKYNTRQREELKRTLHAMNPYKFEHLIKDLLDAMGYEEVEVTTPSNDKGVDVTGIIQSGIASVKEVIQVKRHTANIQRGILDSLRGVLHRFDAFRGTIITTSDFSRGTIEASFETKAAPITLINGDKLVELLIEYQIGIKRKPAEYLMVDTEYFELPAEETGDLAE